MPITTISSPVVITDLGRPAHVLMTYAEYEKLAPKKQQPIAELLAMPEAADIDFEVPRTPYQPRDID